MPPQAPVERTVPVAPGHTVSVRLPRKTPDYQAGVDAFLQKAIASYTTPTGSLRVAPTFMMRPGWDDQQLARQAAKPPIEESALHRALEGVATGAGLSTAVLARLQMGRGTPDEFRTFTQATITELGRTDAGAWRPIEVRQMMWDNATGFDCAGYVQQAYLFATGRSRDQLGWALLGDEGLLNLSGNGFRKFHDVGDLRPGDVIVFNASNPKDPIGHRTIVFDQRVLNDDDAARLAGATGARIRGGGTAPSGPQFAGAGATIRVLEMDSSYGGGKDPARGGVQRQTWLFNESTRLWAWLRPQVDMSKDPSLPTRSLWEIPFVGGLYAQPSVNGEFDVLDGFYRHRAD